MSGLGNTTSPCLESATRGATAAALLELGLGSAVLCASLLGNGLVLAVFRSRPQLLHVANRFVFNLLLADLLQTLLVMPLAVAGSVPGLRPLAGGLCKLLVVSLHLFAFAGVHSTVLVSIDRYLAIMHPLSYPARMTPRRASSLIALSWALGAAQSTPPLYGWGRVAADGCSSCRLLWASSPSYTLLTALLAFWLPAGIMLRCYWLVFRAARRQNARVQPALARSPGGEKRRGRGPPRRSHCKAARVVFVTVASHLLGMGPYSVLGTVSAAGATQPAPWLGAAALILLHSRCCAHPYIYGYLHRGIRRELLLHLPAACCRPPAPGLSPSSPTSARAPRTAGSWAAPRASAPTSWAEASVTAAAATGGRRDTVSTSCSSDNELHLLPGHRADR
ncbi:probable G-protein coupled receptor 101 [Amblyraja radiata]|uniref:probable G-protein coupled receptor 101 n=1 Tax=Amblyraja radiata TaxID=386614 RepID=UPI00140420F8|nr:probable G-protein coupled receptor 101 [Amblyraja radiata]